ncbi:MAG TPA: GNAT family N-acetyltransferase [Gemmatimonadota bacterium]|nr:GNAT family N-acetyltransferase [Gemmatimonadota bacterium]
MTTPSNVAAAIRIEPMRESDWPAVADVYRQGIVSGHATFETDVPSREAWDSSHLRAPRLVAREADRLLGWAALSPVSDRCVYGGVAEVSVYVDGAARGRGIGRRLLESLVQASEEAGIWTLQAGIFPENEASLAIHRSCGFRVVGRRERLGRLAGEWRDVILLERRSTRVGTDGAGIGTR